MFLSGKSHLMLPKLHERYGPVVRLAPNELSFTVPEAWEDIFGRAQPGKRDENQKAPVRVQWFDHRCKVNSDEFDRVQERTG
jgi:hypothetical protein